MQNGFMMNKISQLFQHITTLNKDGYCLSYYSVLLYMPTVCSSCTSEDFASTFPPCPQQVHGLIVVCQQMGQDGAYIQAFFVVVLIEQLVTFSTYFRTWENILIRRSRARLFPFTAVFLYDLVQHSLRLGNLPLGLAIKSHW